MEVLNYVKLGSMPFVLKVHFIAAIILAAVFKQLISFLRNLYGSESVSLSAMN
jgi:hypothetical protein